MMWLAFGNFWEFYIAHGKPRRARYLMGTNDIPSTITICEQLLNDMGFTMKAVYNRPGKTRRGKRTYTIHKFEVQDA